MSNKTLLQEFDDIGFGNQAIIVGTKRVELRYWIFQALDTMREETIKEFENKCYNGGFTYENGAWNIPRQIDWLSTALDTIQKETEKQVKQRYEKRLKDLADLNREYDRKLREETLREVSKKLRVSFRGCACGLHGYQVLPDCKEEKHGDDCADCIITHLKHKEGR